MKKFASLLICLTMLLSLVSCLPENSDNIKLESDRVVTEHKGTVIKTDGNENSSSSDKNSAPQKSTSSTTVKTTITKETKQKVEDKIKDVTSSLSENTDWGGMDSLMGSKDYAEDIIDYSSLDPVHLRPSILIETPQDLINFSNDFKSDSDFFGWTLEFNNDIDMTGYEWIPLGTLENPFDLSIVGNNHTIKNLTITEIDPSVIDSEGCAHLGFIGYSVSDYIVGLNIENISINVSATEDTPIIFAGGLMGTSYPYVTNLVMSEIKVSGNINITGSNLAIGSVGGVFGGAKFESINNGMTLVATESNVNISVDGFYTIAGGIIGTGIFIKDESGSTNFANLTYVGTIDDKSQLSFVGGFCGLCSGEGTPSFKDSYFSTTVKRVLDNETSEDIQILGIIAGGIDVYTGSFAFENITGNIIYNGKIVDSAFCYYEEGKVIYNSCKPNVKLPN